MPKYHYFLLTLNMHKLFCSLNFLRKLVKYIFLQKYEQLCKKGDLLHNIFSIYGLSKLGHKKLFKKECALSRTDILTVAGQPLCVRQIMFTTTDVDK